MSVIVLPPRCNTAASEALLPEMVAALAHGRLDIDGREVIKVGQAVLQLLVSARRSGEGATILASQILRDAARAAGLDQELFEEAAA